MATASVFPTGPISQYSEWVTSGLVLNKSRASVYGHNPSIANGVTADVWEGGGLYPFLAAASQLEVLSASASDTAAGIGARTFLLQGLDADYNQISETLTLNGTTPVATVNNYLRVNQLQIVTAGSGLSNAGDITLRVISGGTTLGIVRAGMGNMANCIISVPAGYTLFVESIFMSVLGAATQNGALFSFTRRNSNGAVFITNQYNVTSNQPFQRVPLLGGPVPQKSDLIIRCMAEQAATNVNASVEGVLNKLT